MSSCPMPNFTRNKTFLAIIIILLIILISIPIAWNIGISNIKKSIDNYVSTNTNLECKNIHVDNSIFTLKFNIENCSIKADGITLKTGGISISHDFMNYNHAKINVSNMEILKDNSTNSNSIQNLNIDTNLDFSLKYGISSLYSLASTTDPEYISDYLKHIENLDIDTEISKSTAKLGSQAEETLENGYINLNMTRMINDRLSSTVDLYMPSYEEILYIDEDSSTLIKEYLVSINSKFEISEQLSYSKIHQLELRKNNININLNNMTLDLENNNTIHINPGKIDISINLGEPKFDFMDKANSLYDASNFNIYNRLSEKDMEYILKTAKSIHITPEDAEKSFKILKSGNINSSGSITAYVPNIFSTNSEITNQKSQKFIREKLNLRDHNKNTNSLEKLGKEMQNELMTSAILNIVKEIAEKHPDYKEDGELIIIDILINDDQSIYVNDTPIDNLFSKLFSIQ